MIILTCPVLSFVGVEGMYKVGQFVRLHTSDNWNELYGIIDEICGDIIAVYCITMPSWRYHVQMENAGNVIELLDVTQKNVIKTI